MENHISKIIKRIANKKIEVKKLDLSKNKEVKIFS
jgi:hypothetical protein